MFGDDMYVNSPVTADHAIVRVDRLAKCAVCERCAVCESVLYVRGVLYVRVGGA